MRERADDEAIEERVEVRRMQTSDWFVAEIDVDSGTGESPRAAVWDAMRESGIIEEVYEVLAPGEPSRAELVALLREAVESQRDERHHPPVCAACGVRFSQHAGPMCWVFRAERALSATPPLTPAPPSG